MAMADLKATSGLVDVVIIGAGLAGLSAADILHRSGVSVMVLEARDRVGGKTWSIPLSGSKDEVVDLGAAWINDTNQSQVYKLAQRFGVELIEQNTNGLAVAEYFDGSCSTFPYGDLPKFDAAIVSDIARIRDMCQEDSLAIDVADSKWKELDSFTFEEYLMSRGASESSIATATIWTRAMLGQEPRDISAMFFLNHCRAGGGLMQMRSDRKDGGQHFRIREGTQSLAKGLAAGLPVNTIRLSSPVIAVKQQERDPPSIDVYTPGECFTAREVISSVPLPALKTIHFTPELPAAKRFVTDSASHGYYTKAMMAFRTPFWIQKGFCGLAQSFTGPASVIRDTSSPTDKKWFLTCFMAGDPGRKWAELSTPERVQALLKQIGKLWDVQSSVSQYFLEMVTYDWSHDQFSGWGCPSTSLPPGVLGKVTPDVLAQPWGNVHFAGSETSQDWRGYLEGAVRSGELAANDVLQDLETRMRARL